MLNAKANLFNKQKLTDAKVLLFYELIYKVKYQNRNLRPFPNIGNSTPINFGKYRQSN
jgi:hypothetical protein